MSTQYQITLWNNVQWMTVIGTSIYILSKYHNHGVKRVEWKTYFNRSQSSSLRIIFESNDHIPVPTFLQSTLSRVCSGVSRPFWIVSKVPQIFIIANANLRLKFTRTTQWQNFYAFYNFTNTRSLSQDWPINLLLRYYLRVLKCSQISVSSYFLCPYVRLNVEFTDH